MEKTTALQSTEKPSVEPNEGSNESEPSEFVKSVYRELLRSVCVDVATNMHRLVKNGEIPFSKLREPESRKGIYPELYKGMDGDSVEREAERYATATSYYSRKRKLDDSAENDISVNDDNDKDGLSTEPRSSAPSPTPSVAASARQADNIDIWGRVPTKEPKEPVECHICMRLVSTSRFAPHLDKCMGLSTRVGPSSGSQRNSAGASSLPS